MDVPDDRRYLESHEWHRREDGDVVVIGITPYAANELTDITYVELPQVGTKVEAGKPFGEIESVKATADLYTGVSGEVIAVNERLANEPELVNQSALEEGWMIRVKMSNPQEYDRLLTAAQYAATIGR